MSPLCRANNVGKPRSRHRTKELITSHTETEKEMFLPYGRQNITEADIETVVKVLRSDWLTQGPTIARFEDTLAEFVESEYAVACSSGTAALHLAMLALDIGKEDVVLTTPNTFLADANCAKYVGADVRFADIDPTTGLIATDSIRNILANDTEHRIKVIIPVHFAGQPAELAEIHKLAREHEAYVVDDACHAIGATYSHDGRIICIGGSSHSDMTVFSFHPVKHVAMGEGGAITTNDATLAERLRRLRNHGIQKENVRLGEMALSPEGTANPWYYEMNELGYNYRLTDIQAALGISQLGRIRYSLDRRQTLAEHYYAMIAKMPQHQLVRPLVIRDNIRHAFHLFVVRIDFEEAGVSRATVMNRLRKNGIGTQVHYIPVHLQPYYRFECGLSEGSLPGADKYYASALSLPMYPCLDHHDIEHVVSELTDALEPTTSGKSKLTLCTKGR